MVTKSRYITALFMFGIEYYSSFIMVILVFQLSVSTEQISVILKG